MEGLKATVWGVPEECGEHWKRGDSSQQSTAGNLELRRYFRITLELQRQSGSLTSQRSCAGSVHTVVSDVEAEPAPHLLSLQGCIAEAEKNICAFAWNQRCFLPPEIQFLSPPRLGPLFHSTAAVPGLLS